MANNNGIFNAALAGASGGVASRWLRNQLPSDYDAIAAQLVIFATAVDQEIPTDPTITERATELMQSICEQVIASRWPVSITLATAQNIARAIKALWIRIRSEMLEEGTVVKQLLNWDGVAPAILTVLPAGHAPGMYLVLGCFVISSPDAGVAFKRVTWSDAETSTAQFALSTGPIFFTGGISGELTVPVTEGQTTVMSDGLVPVVVSFEPGGAGPAFLADVYASATFVGKKA